MTEIFSYLYFEVSVADKMQHRRKLAGDNSGALNLQTWSDSGGCRAMKNLPVAIINGQRKASVSAF